MNAKGVVMRLSEMMKRKAGRVFLRSADQDDEASSEAMASSEGKMPEIQAAPDGTKLAIASIDRLRDIVDALEGEDRSHADAGLMLAGGWPDRNGMIDMARLEANLPAISDIYREPLARVISIANQQPAAEMIRQSQRLQSISGFAVHRLIEAIDRQADPSERGDLRAALGAVFSFEGPHDIIEIEKTRKRIEQLPEDQKQMFGRLFEQVRSTVPDHAMVHAAPASNVRSEDLNLDTFDLVPHIPRVLPTPVADDRAPSPFD